jgi:hypothetical protein
VIEAVGEPVTLLEHSYGALCAIGAVRLGAAVERLVLYEAPLPVDDPPDTGSLDRARRLLNGGDSKGALMELLRSIVELPEKELAFVGLLPDSWFDDFASTTLREMSVTVLVGSVSAPRMTRPMRDLADLVGAGDGRDA